MAYAESRNLDLEEREMTMLCRAMVFIISLVFFAGCAGSGSLRTPPLYERLGGKGALVAMVNDLAVRIGRDPRINAHFAGVDMPVFSARLVDQLCQATGGPCRYKGKEMRAAHAGRGITNAEFDALVEDLGHSMDRFRVPDKEKKELLAILLRMRKHVVD